MPSDEFNNETWQQIDRLLDRLSDLTRCDTAEADFYTELLNGLIQTQVANTAIAWNVTVGKNASPIAWASADSQQEFPQFVQSQPHLQFLSDVCQTSERIESHPPVREMTLSGQRLIACSIRIDDDTTHAIEIVRSGDLSLHSQKAITGLLDTLRDTIQQYHRNRHLDRLKTDAESWKQIDRFAEQVHCHLNLDSVAYCIANDGRNLAGCDRLAVAIRRGHGYRILAISGVDSVEPRAEQVRALQRLAEQVAPTGETVWYCGDNEDLPPEWESVLGDYVDVTHARTVVVRPLRARSPKDNQRDAPACAVLVFETLKATELDDRYHQRVETISRHSTSALQNAVKYDRLPLVSWLSAFAQWRSTRAWSGLLLGSLLFAAVVIALCLIPAELTVTATGTAQPLQQRRVFAPRDGRITQLLVRHGDRVSAGQVLAKLDSPDLAFQYTKVLGEIQTAQEELNAVSSARLGAVPTTTAQRDELARLTADEQRLKKTLQALASQRDLLELERAETELRSPINGQVLTWQLAETLETRPVVRGQALLTIGDTDGPWQLEVHVQDKDVKIVEQAQQQATGGNEVTFRLASQPAIQHHGRLSDLARRIEPTDDRQLAALATVSVDSDKLEDLHPGTGVTARIHCGSRPIGYVWLRDLIDSVRRWFFI